MKTVEKKAIDFMQEMEGNSNVVIKDHDFENIKAGLIRLLKEQARDTRHACAGVVMNCPEDMSASDLKDSAYNACMNVKTI